MEATRATISHFQGSWSSGLATLVFEDGSHVLADSGPLGRALDSAFDCVGPGHCIDNSKINGKEIVYLMDDMGLTMAGFVPYEEWLDYGQPEIEPGESITVEPNETE
jgi:hypothetical protein